MSAELGAALASLLLAAAGLIKVITSDLKRKSEVKEINDDRKATRENYDAHLAKIDTRLDGHDESLKQGNERFNKTDAKLDEMAQKTDAKLDRLNDKQDATTSKIDQLIGFVQASAGKVDKWG